MDPSADLCIIQNSFSNTGDDIDYKKRIIKESEKSWYNEKDTQQLAFKPEIINVDESPAIKFCDIERYYILQQVKDSYNVENFLQARNQANPYEYIGNSIFLNRAAVKLANIDAVLNITNEVFSFDVKNSLAPFTFCDIAAGPGGFTQYLQYRFPNSQGYGITLRQPGLDWNKILNYEKFQVFYGPDDTGNLYSNWNHFINFVLSHQPNGVDLLTADGGIDLDEKLNSTSTSPLHKQEFLSSRLLLIQSLIGISLTKLYGNFVLKIFDSVTDLSAQILFILSNCFEKIMLFKPVTSRPGNSERYIICRNKLPTFNLYIPLLVNAVNHYTETSYLTNIFSNSLPQSFINWLTYFNNQSIDLQLYTAQNILSILNGSPISLPQYDIPKFLIIWNLPDTPPFRSRSKTT